VEVQRLQEQHPDRSVDPSGRAPLPRRRSRHHGPRYNLVVQARRRRLLANLMVVASSVFVLAGALVCYLLLE